MADVVVTVRIMPDSPDSNLSLIADAAKKCIIKFGGTFGRSELEPIAFGLKAIIILFSIPEEKGSTEQLEKSLSSISSVSSVQVTDVRRAIG